MHGNQISCFGLIPNQSTTNEHKVRLVKNGHTSGQGRRLGQFSNPLINLYLSPTFSS